MRRTALAAALALLAAACGRAGSPVSGEPPAYEYTVTVPPAGSWELVVEARLEHVPGELVLPEAAGAVRDVMLVDGHGPRPLPRVGDRWNAPACRHRCTVRYVIDLQALASSCRGHDCTRRVGDAVVGSAAAWMLRPDSVGVAGPLPRDLARDPAGDAVVHVDVVGDISRWATGLRRDPRGGYVMRSRELGEAAYTAVGAFRRDRIEVGGATLDVALLGAPLAMGDASTLGWVRDSAACVSSLYGRFPVSATLFVLPVQGADGVVFGRVLSLAGASVALLFGAETRAAVEHDDWVVVHELSHLGMPSFVGEGHWLEEGLATYYEPILRERAGWLREEDLWRHFVQEMPRGLRKPGEPPSLEERDDIDSTYWGGALFALLADLRIRASSAGARSLDDVMRASLARLGDATHEARVADFLRVAGEATGGDALASVYRRFALRGDAMDLDETWRAMGVVRRPDGSVVLREDAPLAATRRAIAAGKQRSLP